MHRRGPFTSLHRRISINRSFNRKGIRSILKRPEQTHESFTLMILPKMSYLR